MQYYKGIPLNLIPYHPEYYATKRAKRFGLGKRKYGQNIWIPNRYLEKDGTIKPRVNIDFVMITAVRQNKFKYTGLEWRPDYMTADEIIKAAWSGKRPSGMKLYEHNLYYEMRLTYAMYRRGEIDKTQGETEKAEALERYEKGKLKHDSIVETYGVMD